MVFASRLLKTKGVMEFVSAARLLRQRGHNVRFWLTGSVDPGNPTTVSDNDLERWR